MITFEHTLDLFTRYAAKFCRKVYDIYFSIPIPGKKTNLLRQQLKNKLRYEKKIKTYIILRQ